MNSLEKLPLGLWFMRLCCGFTTYQKHFTLNKIAILLLTYWSYMALHASRKSFPIVKNTLKGCDILKQPNCTNTGFSPFNTKDSITLLSLMDTLWAVFYAIFMFISGHIAERTSLRGVLGISLILSGIINCCFGIAKYLVIHSIIYFISLQILSGIFQSFGWPSIMGIMGYWFGHGKLGSILGLWNSHVYVGNILGQILSSYFVENDWALSFIVPGSFNIFTGIIMILFIIGSPIYIGFNTNSNISPSDVEKKPLLQSNNDNDDPQLSTNGATTVTKDDIINETQALDFTKALLIPGVIEYSMSLFFSKLVTYTFLFWLPFYISNVGINNQSLSTSTAGYMALVFDIGAIFGCFFIGLASDLSGNKSATVCVICQILSAISLLLYSLYGSISYNICIVLLLVTGFFTCAPSSLITTAVSNNLGNHPKLGTKKGKAIIAAIIDGTGSIGSAIGPFIVNLVSKFGLKYLMFIMMISVLLSSLFLLRITYNEIKHYITHTHK